MIKIEMLPELDTNAKIGVSHREYIWLDGQPWPVEENDDHRIGKIEAFGAELDLLSQIPGGDVQIRGYKCWYRDQAGFVSNYMRIRRQ
jgi:hypothetical protein